MRSWVVAIVTVWGFAACGRDPILEKAEADAEAADAARVARGSSGTGSEPGGAGAAGGTPGLGVPGAAQPGDASGGPRAPVGPDGQTQPGAPGEPPPGIPEEPAPGVPGSPSAPQPGAGAGAAVDPGAPRPGVPTEPAPGIPSQPPPGSGAGGTTGPTVKVSGTVVFAGWKGGRVKITAFDGDHGAAAGGHPKVIGMAELDRPGAFVVPVAQGAGKVYFEASIDEDGDGRPGPLDPQGKADRFPLTVAASAVEGLTITLVRREPPPGGRGEDF